jgi:hypothetical protein
MEEGSTAMLVNWSDYWLLWSLLLIFLVFVLFVGRKAAPDVELKKGVGYSRPMLAFELNADDAPNMFSSWDERTKEKLKVALLWDYIFIFIYPGAIAIACFLAGLFLDGRGIVPMKVTIILMSLQLIAAILDASENFALLKVLEGSLGNAWPQIARWCAILKFAILSVGLGYAVLLGGGARLVTWMRS